MPPYNFAKISFPNSDISDISDILIASLIYCQCTANNEVTITIKNID